MPGYLVNIMTALVRSGLGESLQMNASTGPRWAPLAHCAYDRGRTMIEAMHPSFSGDRLPREGTTP
jgi:hypothetical protein